MFSCEALFIPENPICKASHPLTKPVIAVELVHGRRGGRLGRITRLPDGSCLEICGDGYNERTIKVRWRDRYYFVLLNDLHSVA